MLPHSPKQSLSLGQNCFEGCRTPAGSQADDAGSQNNQDNSKKKEFWPFRHSAGTGGAGDWQEGSVPGVCPLLLSSVPWERHCPGEVLWSRRQQHRCDLCCVGKCRRCSAQVQSSVCAPAAPESWQGLGCRDLSPSPPAHVHSRLLTMLALTPSCAPASPAGAPCERDRLSFAFCQTLRLLGRCHLPTVHSQCCRSCRQHGLLAAPRGHQRLSRR